MTENHTSWPGLEDIWLLVVFLGFGPVMVLINNPEGPPPWTVLLFVVVAVGVALLLRTLLSRAGLDGRGLTYAIAVGGFSALNLGMLLGSIPRGLLLVQVGAVAVLAYLLRGLRVFQFLVTWACLALAVGPLVLVIQRVVNDSGSVAIGSPEDLAPFRSRPDVVVVVADGYGSGRVLSEFYGYDNRSFYDDLAALEMVTNQDMRSNYARTKFSVSAFLDLGYLPVDTEITHSVESGLARTMGGHNRITTTMKGNGYRTVYLESGWLGARCGDAIDVCLAGPWPDETYYDIVHRSVFRGLPGFEEGIAFSRGADHAIETLDGDLEGFLANSVPDFIFVHLLVPHPPFFMSESCETEPSAEMAGFALSFPDSTQAEVERRSAAYIAQVKCTNEVLAKSAERISKHGAVGLFFGDHGPDKLGQLFENADGWTDEQRHERLGVMFAAHHPGCDYESIVTLVNAGRRLLSCLSGSDLDSLPDRFFDIDKSERTPRVMEIQPPPGLAR
jgi:hypothetical protein